MEDFEKEFKRNTLIELSDLLLELQDILQAKGWEDFTQEDMDNVFRVVHSIKGNSKSCELTVISDISHTFENLLIHARDGETPYTKHFHEITLEYCDRMQEAVENLQRDLNYQVEFSTIESMIEKFHLNPNPDKNLNKNLHPHDLGKGLAEISVLVVDDDPDVSEILEVILKNGFKANIVTAVNGEDALIMCAQKEFHIILCDFKMPIMNGGEFIHHLRNKSNANRRTPVLFISGYRPKLSAEQNTWEDVFFIEKPFSESKILYYARCGLELKEAKLLSQAV